MLITDSASLEQFCEPRRVWQGIPGVEITRGGRLFVTFYSGGTREQLGNYCLLYKSDDGVDFGKPVAAAFCPGKRCYDPCLWIDPLGRLWFFWAVMPEHAVRCVVCQHPDADCLEWSAPVTIGHDVMMNKPVVLSTGEWLFPIAVWDEGVRVLAPEYDTKSAPSGSYVYRSADNGETVVPLGRAAVPRRSYDEHMVVERADMSLMMLVRTYYGIGISCSYDRGRTWSPGADSGIPGPSSRFFLRRLASGRLLLVNHYAFSGRNNLTALLSEDDGVTWPWRLLLDGRDEVSYPDGAQAEDGSIYIVYDRERGAFKTCLADALTCAREILLARVTEDDIMAGRLVSPDSFLKRTVSALGEYGGGDNPFGEADMYSDAALADMILKTYRGVAAAERVFELYPRPCRGLKGTDAARVDKLTERLRSGSGGERKVLCELVGLVRGSPDGGDEAPVIKRVTDAVAAGIGGELSVRELADSVGISLYYLCHLFKKTTGTTVVRYRNALRLALAKRMLVETDDKISDIAARCGYNSSSYFSEVFVHDESMTPGRFRQLHGMAAQSRTE